MSTISENLQIIADSTSAIKQAIIDKGGTIEGDITTWANAISGLSGGGSGGSGSDENHSEINTVYVGKKPVSSGVPMSPGATYVAAHCFFQKPLDSSIQIVAMVSTGDGPGTATVEGYNGDTSVITTGVADASSFCVDVCKHFIQYGDIFGNSKYIYDIKYLETNAIKLSCRESGPDEYSVALTTYLPLPSDLYAIIDGKVWNFTKSGDYYISNNPMYPKVVTVNDVTLSYQHDDEYYYVVTS